MILIFVFFKFILCDIRVDALYYVHLIKLIHYSSIILTLFRFWHPCWPRNRLNKDGFIRRWQKLVKFQSRLPLKLPIMLTRSVFLIMVIYYLLLLLLSDYIIYYYYLLLLLVFMPITMILYKPCSPLYFIKYDCYRSADNFTSIVKFSSEHIMYITVENFRVKSTICRCCFWNISKM